MKLDQKKVKELIKASKQVILDNCLENGAIVAANSDKKYYPKKCQSYRYVWPRDACNQIFAANILGIKGIQAKFFDWILDRAEEVQKDGLLFQNYYTHGAKRWVGFQPDNNALVIMAIFDTYKSKTPEKYKNLMKLLSDGLCRIWDKDHFCMKTQDVWENRNTYPDIKDNHTYTLAMCIRALLIAYEVLHEDEYLIKAREMRELLPNAYKGYFHRTFGGVEDKIVDASVLGLVWPSAIISPHDRRMVATVRKIEQKLVKNWGVHRYEHDLYDGWTYHTEDRRKGGGAWPMLNCWMSIYYSRLGNKAKAQQYLGWVLENVDKYIPEQVFDNDVQEGVSPLGEAHPLSVIASKKLDLLKE
jgi:GH15 family glucan-1,4-alpha-glucosidase